MIVSSCILSTSTTIPTTITENSMYNDGIIVTLDAIENTNLLKQEDNEVLSNEYNDYCMSRAIR